MRAHRLLEPLTFCALTVALALGGCASESSIDTPDSGAGGAVGSGGESTVGTGGSGSGGAHGTGGSNGTGGSGSGGATGTGGRGSGGITGTGGGDGMGGTIGTGGRGTGTGGAVGTGGRGTGTGGAVGTGGAGGAVGTGGKTGSGGTTGSGGRSGTINIMPLGDSTTASICYRSHLWQMLTQAGHTNFNFTGTRNGDPGCSFTGYDKDNEGHAGYIVTDLLKAVSTGRPGGADTTDPYDSSAKDLVTWFDGHPADIVMMHFGTNDVWNNIPASKITMAYSAILAKLRSNNANVRLMIAQITPLDPSGCTTCAAGAVALNTAIVQWAKDNNTASSPIQVVDQYDGFNADTDTKDGVHATDAGSIKIATNWYNALLPFF
jgi:acyl-CoA thioesterase-1